MPELPEAETIARELAKALTGRTLERVVLSRRDIVRSDGSDLEKVVPGSRVVGVSRRGKRVILSLEPACEMTFRLGMTGRLTCANKHEALESHTHLQISLGDSKRELRFRDPRRFGGIWLHVGPTAPDNGESADLGPEPLELRLAGFRRVLSRRRQIKALLMDQQAIAGLGNIYCDESLHAAGIHPLRPADTLRNEEASRLLRSIKTTLRKAIRFNGTTLMDYRRTDGRSGSFQDHHRVYQREDKPCRSCKKPIVRIIAAGRSTFFCPRCQPLAAGLPAGRGRDRAVARRLVQD